MFDVDHLLFYLQIIPAGADILLNMASVLHDETVFEEPNKFKPERYLTGDIALKKQRTIPFSIGKYSVIYSLVTSLANIALCVLNLT